MGNEVFDFKTKGGSTGTVSFRTRTAQFGDGYAQIVGDGLNGRGQSWNVTLLGPTGTAICGAGDYDAAKAFIDRHAGFKSFLWTPPGEAQARFICNSYSPNSLGGGVFTLSAKFTQVFFP